MIKGCCGHQSWWDRQKLGKSGRNCGISPSIFFRRKREIGTLIHTYIRMILSCNTCNTASIHIPQFLRQNWHEEEDLAISSPILHRFSRDVAPRLLLCIRRFLSTEITWKMGNCIPCFAGFKYGKEEEVCISIKSPPIFMILIWKII